jgi:large subunit ribosomal protein L20
MPKANNAVASKARRKRVLKKAKGYWGSRGNILTVVKHAVDKGEQYAYRDRRAKKRSFRSLWIIRINAAARLNGTTYSRLMDAMIKKNVRLHYIQKDIMIRISHFMIFLKKPMALKSM